MMWRFVGVVGVLLLGGCLVPSGVEKEGDVGVGVGVNGDGTSRLDEAGVARIKETGEVFFDVSDGQLLLSDVGLSVGDHVPDVSAEFLMDVVVRGPKGEVVAQTDYLRFLAYDGDPDIALITYFLTAESGEELVELVRYGLDNYRDSEEGMMLSTDNIEGRLEGILREPERPRRFETTIGYGPGFAIDYSVDYKGVGHVNVIIVGISPTVASAEDWDAWD